MKEKIPKAKEQISQTKKTGNSNKTSDRSPKNLYQPHDAFFKANMKFSATKKISPVLPVVFYQGAKKWCYPQLTQLLSQDTPEEILPYLPLYQALFYDFSLENQAKLKGKKLELELYLRMIKAIYEPDQKIFTQEIIEIFKDIGSFDENIFFEYMERSMTYISATRQDISDKNIMNIIQQGGNAMETIIDRLEKRGRMAGLQEGRREGRLEGRLEGRQEGRQEGEYEAKLSVAKKMKQDGFSVEKIMEYTGLSEETIAAL
ncbi:hypothetical protein EII17_03740 [Clostridiales bacterium COT073_COT-073]|nr:hypothetical protein EII17_03740 [Clostridiales bacterium COT073_COT-073]